MDPRRTQCCACNGGDQEEGYEVEENDWVEDYLGSFYVGTQPAVIIGPSRMPV